MLLEDCKVSDFCLMYLKVEKTLAFRGGNQRKITLANKNSDKNVSVCSEAGGVRGKRRTQIEQVKNASNQNEGISEAGKSVSGTY